LHRAFNSALTANHVTVGKFVNMLRREQGLQDAKIEQQRAGVLEPQKRQKYKNLDERLNNVVKRYDETNNNQYLRSIAIITWCYNYT